MLTVTPVASASSALDSTPDSTGTIIYYTGATAGVPGIFALDNKGNATPFFTGDPLAAPLGISISGDDKTLFVADSGYDTMPGNTDTPVGAVLTLPTAPATPTIVSGTEGYRPRGLDVYPEVTGDTIYFTGKDPATGAAGVFERATSGGVVTAVASGAAFVDPSGIAVGKNQMFVTDAIGSNLQLARLTVIDRATNTPSTFVDDLGIGYPAGVALSVDEKTVYVSGIDLATGFDRVLIVDVASKMVTSYGDKDPNIMTNTDAGGLHRSRKSEVYSWADLTAGGAGTVYRIEFK